MHAHYKKKKKNAFKLTSQYSGLCGYEVTMVTDLGVTPEVRFYTPPAHKMAMTRHRQHHSLIYIYIYFFFYT